MFTVFLPVAGVEVWYPGLVALGVATGVLTGLLGIGGGFIITPALRIIFGVPYPLAVGASLLQITAATALSARGHWRQKNVDCRLAAVMAAGSLLGAEAGVRLLAAISASGTVIVGGQARDLVDLVLNGCYFLLMVAVAGLMLRESLAGGAAEPSTALAAWLQGCAVPPFIACEYAAGGRIGLWVPVAISLAVGMLAGLLGIGGGFVGLPLMIYLLGMPTRLAVGTSSFQVALASAYGGLRHWQAGHVDFVLVGMLILGAFAGVQAGVRLCGRVNGRQIRKGFAVLLLLAAAFVASALFSATAAH